MMKRQKSNHRFCSIVAFFWLYSVILLSYSHSVSTVVVVLFSFPSLNASLHISKAITKQSVTAFAPKIAMSEFVIPWTTHKEMPITCKQQVAKEIACASRSRITFKTCGKKAIVVKIPAILPIMYVFPLFYEFILPSQKCHT